MLNKINLITGETYTLRELFSGTRRIIIPDLQRDYCWGNPMQKSKDDAMLSYAEGFIDTLLEQFEAHPYGRLNLGIIYGYESPQNYVHLCDGQQRITTLFLLLGMLNRWAADDRYRHYLISDFEYLDDDHDPYLQYAIRESSLYFMSDLVYRFFTRGEDEDVMPLQSVSDIYNSATGESCSWFYGEYITDPSIRSMLRCLESIERKKSQLLGEDDADRLERLVEFLVDRLTFIYYDMGTRANGEETFVVINTTGEPLSATENLKPIVITHEVERVARGQKRVDDCDTASDFYTVGDKRLTVANAWEEMENYFWNIRRKSDFDTADNGFKEFLRWVVLLHLYTVDKDRFKQNASDDFDVRFPHTEISMGDIIDVFNAFVKLRNKYSNLFDVDKLPGRGDRLKQIELFVLLPMLAYLRQHTSEDERNVRRLWYYLTNLSKVENVSKAVNDVLIDVIGIGTCISDIIDILNIKEPISATILTSEERFKLEILRSMPTPEERCDFEEDMWTAQTMEVDVPGQLLFQGEIQVLLKWATSDCVLDTSRFNAKEFKDYLKQLQKLFRVSKDHTVNDMLRRAIMAWGYKGMPWGKSYGWRHTWREILNHDPGKFRDFIDAVKECGIEGVIRTNACNSAIVRYPEILAYCDKKNLDTWHTFGLAVCQRSYAQPIPLALAEIMLKVGLRLQRCAQEKGNWRFEISKNEVLLIRPVESSKNRVREIQVSAVNGGQNLHYYVEKEGGNFDITLSLTSMHALVRWLYPSDKRPKSGSAYKKLHHRKDRGSRPISLRKVRHKR